MKAACWHGTREISIEDVPEPRVTNPRDAVVRVSSSAICGSDLHLYNNMFPGMHRGDILGHEFMGDVVAVGPGVKNLKEGDRVVVPCTIACGSCFFCKRSLFSCCDNSNPSQVESESTFGYPGCGFFGYSHTTGGYAGGQAQLVRVPFADVGPIKVPADVADERVLFLSDILPTAWMGAENCQLEPGDTVAVWGLGPVGQLAVRCLKEQGRAERIIAIDDVDERLAMAAGAGFETIDMRAGDVYEQLYDATHGLGPDACLDAVGMEAHGTGALATMDRLKQKVGLESDRPIVLREAIKCCRKGGTISVLGVYSGMIDKFPMGLAMNKGLTFRMSQVHVHRYKDLLLEKLLSGAMRPEEIITHTLPLDRAADGYRVFNEKAEGCVKVVLKPQEVGAA